MFDAISRLRASCCAARLTGAAARLHARFNAPAGQLCGDCRGSGRDHWQHRCGPCHGRGVRANADLFVAAVTVAWILAAAFLAVGAAMAILP